MWEQTGYHHSPVRQMSIRIKYLSVKYGGGRSPRRGVLRAGKGGLTGSPGPSWSPDRKLRDPMGFTRIWWWDARFRRPGRGCSHDRNRPSRGRPAPSHEAGPLSRESTLDVDARRVPPADGVAITTGEKLQYSVASGPPRSAKVRIGPNKTAFQGWLSHHFSWPGRRFSRPLALSLGAPHPKHRIISLAPPDLPSRD